MLGDWRLLGLLFIKTLDLVGTLFWGALIQVDMVVTREETFYGRVSAKGSRDIAVILDGSKEEGVKLEELVEVVEVKVNEWLGAVVEDGLDEAAADTNLVISSLALP